MLTIEIMMVDMILLVMLEITMTIEMTMIEISVLMTVENTLLMMIEYNLSCAMIEILMMETILLLWRELILLTM